MALVFERTTRQGGISRLPLNCGLQRIKAEMGDHYRILDEKGNILDSGGTVRRLDNHLFIEDLPGGSRVQLEDFYGSCSAGSPCTLTAPGTIGTEITPGTQPIGALSDGGFLIHGGAGPVPGSVATTAPGFGEGAHPPGDVALAAPGKSAASPQAGAVGAGSGGAETASGASDGGGMSSTGWMVLGGLGLLLGGAAAAGGAGGGGGGGGDATAVSPTPGPAPAPGTPPAPGTTPAPSPAPSSGSLPAATIDKANDDMPARTGAIDNGGVTNDRSPTFTGHLSAPLQAGQTLVLLRDGKPVDAKVQVNGTSWSVADKDVPDGAHSWAIRVSGADGHVQSSPAFAFTVDTHNDISARISNAIDDYRNFLGMEVIVPNKGSTDDLTPRLVGTVGQPLGAGDIVQVSRNGTVIGNAKVTGTSWTFDDTGLAANKVYDYTVQVIDAAGNSGPASAKFTIRTDGGGSIFGEGKEAAGTAGTLHGDDVFGTMTQGDEATSISLQHGHLASSPVSPAATMLPAWWEQVDRGA